MNKNSFFEDVTLIINEWNPAEIYPLLYEEYEREVEEVLEIVKYSESMEEISRQVFSLFKRKFGTEFYKSLKECEEVANNLMQLKKDWES